MPGGGWPGFMASRKPVGTPQSEHRAAQRWTEQPRKGGAGVHGNAVAVRPFPVVTRDMIMAKSARAAARCADRRLSSRGSSVGSRPFTAPSEPSSPRPATSESKRSRVPTASARGPQPQRHMSFATGPEWELNPFTAPSASEPRSSRPATSESKRSRVPTANVRGPQPRVLRIPEWELNPEPEIESSPEFEPELEPALEPALEEDWSWNCQPHRHPEVIRLNQRPANSHVHHFRVLANGNRLEMRRQGDESRTESQLSKTPPSAEDAREADKERNRERQGETARDSEDATDVRDHYQCIAEPGAIVRSGIELTTEQTGVIYSGEMVVALDQGLSSTGVSRVRCDRGWVSVNAANGQPVLVSAEDTAHVDGNRAEAAAPSPQGAHRARPPTGGSADRSRLRNNRPRVAAGAGDAYPKMPAGTLGLSAGHALRQQQLEERRRSKPPSGRKSVSSAALQDEGIGPVVRGRQWHHMVRKLKHTDPTTGAATAVRPAVGVASEVRSEAHFPFPLISSY